MIRDAPCSFAQERLQRGVIEAVTVPETYGGASASYVAYGLAAREAERVDAGDCW